jgi:thioredoxin-related protein
MSKFVKGFGLVLLLGTVSFFIWNSGKKEPVALTPEELIQTMKAEKIETHPVALKEPKPIFNMVDSLARLEFYKIHAVVKKKILMVYFYTNGCYFCEKMKNITFADSRVQKELAKNYIVVSINYSTHKNIFKKHFPLHATPAIIFFDREGVKMEEESSYGYQGAEDFYNRIVLLAEPF